MRQQDKKFLGTGLNFPLRTNARGQISLVSGAEDIEQAIRIILSTRPGERVMRPTFGCRAHELLFEPIAAATSSRFQEYINEALRMWEPRIEVTSINIVNNNGGIGSLLAEIEYTIKATHDTRSIVHPFYISEEQEID